MSRDATDQVGERAAARAHGVATPLNQLKRFDICSQLFLPESLTEQRDDEPEDTCETQNPGFDAGLT
jgi:hypothetical protein